MQITIKQGAMQLEQGQSARLEQICGAELVSLAGAAWITIDGDPRDIILVPGQSHVVDSNASVLITALNKQARFALHAGKADAAPCRKAPSRMERLFDALTPRTVNKALAGAL